MTLNALTTLAQLKDFLPGAQGMVAVSDFDVEKDPRTGPIVPNPAPARWRSKRLQMSQVMRS
jgi:hypothetical protein